jgi:hypothetical protein
VVGKDAAIDRIMGTEPKKKGKGTPRPEAKQLSQMKLWCTALGYKWVAELQFAPPRKFRFDIAIPSKMIAIEYEGLNSEKSGHTTITGYSSDTEKYNLANDLGWKVYRYTVLNFENMINDLSNSEKTENP